MTPGERVDNPVARTFTLPREGLVIRHHGRNYSLGKYIGEGSWGAVFHCTDDWENELVAKILKPRNRTYEAVKEEWVKELSNLVKLRHPNITFVYDSFEYRDTFYIIIERCDHTINELIVTPNIDGEEWLPVVAHSVLQGIAFIHKEGYVHKDIHPGNIFSSLAHEVRISSRRRTGIS
jgi:serine/threonine-protein kinase